MPKILLVDSLSLSDEQRKRLDAVGQVQVIATPSTADEWVNAASGADIICADVDRVLLSNLHLLHDVFVTWPGIESGTPSTEELAKNGVSLANVKGATRDSIVEWTLFALLSLLRKFPGSLNVTKDIPFERTQSLVGKKVLIVGKGDMGSRIGEVCDFLGMDVRYFVRGDALQTSAKDADVIINCLNVNSSSKNLLDEQFFMSLKPGSYFVSFVRQYTYDLDGMGKALEAGVLAGAAIDCDPEKTGDTKNAFYQKALSLKNVLLTPHVAYATMQARQNGIETLVQNVEAFAAGKPQNILTKI